MESLCTPSSHQRGPEIFLHGEGLDWYLVICLGGLQQTVKTEIEHHLAAGGWEVDLQVFQEDCRGAQNLTEGVHNGQAGCGKLLLATDASPENLRSLRCVQALFALVAHAPGLDIGRPTIEPPAIGTAPPGAEVTTPDYDPYCVSEIAPEETSPLEAALARLESLVISSLLWPAAINVWKRFRDFEENISPVKGINNGGIAGAQQTGAHQPGATSGNTHACTVADANVKTLKFRASVVRDGLHPFNSVDAAPRLGGAVWTVNPGWTVDLKEYDVEVVMLILERGVVVGLSLQGDRTKRCSNGRIPKEDKGFIETGNRMSSLRPSTAYLMLSLAAPAASDVVVDCMCGVGTIPFLGAEWFPDTLLMGGEVDVVAMGHVQQNLQSLRQQSGPKPPRPVGAAACAWDAQSLPLRDGTVDAMVVDMPFGLSCSTPRANGKLYPTIMAEMARVLRRGSGRAVLLVTQPHLLGLPELVEQERRKNNKKSRRKERKGQKVGNHREENNASGHGRREDCPSGYNEQQTCAENIADERRKEAEGVVSHDPKDKAQASCDLLEWTSAKLAAGTQKGLNVGAPGKVWHIRARYAVNVGGLISWLLVLDRTGEPAPPAVSNRRKRWVGLNLFCKRRKEQHTRTETAASL